MDDPAVDPAHLAYALRMIRGVNRHLGGTSAVLGHLRKWSSRWPEGRPITILDIATGSADIPEAICDWAASTGKDVRIIALDIHTKTLSIAREWTVGRRALPITFLRADALALPLADASVDYAVNSMFLHHLDDGAALACVGEMLRVARRGVIVNDLLRSIPAKIFIHLLTIPAGPIDKHDARVSVAKAWTRREVVGWSRDHDAPWLRYHRHLFSRFTLAGERPDLISSPAPS